MQPIVAVIAPGMMGSAVAKRLTANGLEVRTLLEGRGADTLARAKDAGMIGVSDAQIAACDIILSILPPGNALELAEKLAPALRAATKKPVYVDCNALDPASVLRIARVVEETGATFVDGGIIGGPPDAGLEERPAYICRSRRGEGHGSGTIRPDHAGAAGPDRRRLGDEDVVCRHHQRLHCPGRRDDARRDTRRHRRGVAGGTSSSQPALFNWLTRQCRECIPKRIVGLQKWKKSPPLSARIPAAAKFYQGAAQLYERIAADFEGPNKETAMLDAFCKKRG